MTPPPTDYIGLLDQNETQPASALTIPRDCTWYSPYLLGKSVKGKGKVGQLGGKVESNDKTALEGGMREGNEESSTAISVSGLICVTLHLTDSGKYRPIFHFKVDPLEKKVNAQLEEIYDLRYYARNEIEQLEKQGDMRTWDTLTVIKRSISTISLDYFHCLIPEGQKPDTNANNLTLVSAVVPYQDGFVLVDQQDDPGWSLPGRYLQSGETVKKAAVEVVAQKTGLITYPVGVVGFFHSISPNVGNSITNFAILMCYQAGQLNLTANEKVRKVRVFSMEEIMNESMRNSLRTLDIRSIMPDALKRPATLDVFMYSPKHELK